MFRQSSFFAAIACVLFPFTSLARELPEKVSISQTLPTWVEAIEPDITAADPVGGIADGVYYLLSDLQSNPQLFSRFRHFAVRLSSADGVEDNSSISVDFDPDYQELIWHKIDIIRDGVRIDQLPTQNFRVASNESQDDLIYDNSLNCTAIIDGTQKGDVLEYAYSIIGKNPITGDRFSTWFSLNYSVPVARIVGRVIRDPNDRPLQFKLHDNHGIELKLPKPEKKGDTIEYRFERNDVAALHIDENVPYNYMAYSYLQVSDWTSWAEISDWGRVLYHYKDTDITLPADLEAALAEWKALGHPKDQAMAALDWVQEEIRYVGIMIGPHNYQPYKISQTLQRRFGDCKDKTQLLCYLLTQLGIEANPTLVNTDEEGLIGVHLPTPGSFDHVITKVTIDGQSYWFDPTNSSQGGPIETIWHNNYELGLELKPDVSELSAVLGQGAEESKTFIHEKFSMAEYNTEMQLEVYSRYTGAQADSMRRYVESAITAEIEKEYINYYAQNYPEITSAAPIEFKDNPERNIFEINEYYTIQNGWIEDPNNAAKTDFDVDPDLLRSAMFLSDTRIRTMPAAQSFPNDYTEVIEIVLPAEGSFENESTQTSTPWFEFSNIVEVNKETLTLRYSYKNLTPTIPAADYPEYAKKIEAANDTLGYSITFTDGEKRQALADANPTPSSPYMATYLSAILAAILGLLTAAWLVTRKCMPPLPPTNRDLDGLSGWLVLPALGIIVTPFIYIAGLFEQADAFDSAWITSFTSQASDSYIPGFEPLILAEVAVNVFCLIISVAMIFLFFKKRAIMKPTYIVFAIVSVLIIIVDASITDHLLVKAGYDAVGEYGDVMPGVIKVVIWGLYFAVSERVRATFRN
ncbi:MAG: DUF3857 domain-containing protein [Opitutales bacterium]|nr:DUF3857 domain-containing protein [Opitutales bacterium]